MIDLAHLERLAKEGSDEALIMFTNAHGGKRNTILSLISMIRQARNKTLDDADTAVFEIMGKYDDCGASFLLEKARENIEALKIKPE